MHPAELTTAPLRIKNNIESETDQGMAGQGRYNSRKQRSVALQRRILGVR